MPGAIVVAGVIIGVFVMIGLQGSNTGGGAPRPEANVNIEDVKTEGSPYIGRPDAPVVVAYWSDFQCPFCKAFEVGGVPQIPVEPAMPRIISEYVDTGKVKVVFKDFQFLSEDSTTAGLYARAVWELYPEKYWEWREEMYEAQDEEHGGFGDEESILALTGAISGMDVDRLKSLVDEKRADYTALLEADRAEGASFGINGTPGFIIGKKLIPGVAEFEEFKAAIEEQL